MIKCRKLTKKDHKDLWAFYKTLNKKELKEIGISKKRE